jgi:hypothetical protein
MVIVFLFCVAHNMQIGKYTNEIYLRKDIHYWKNIFLKNWDNSEQHERRTIIYTQRMKERKKS